MKGTNTLRFVLLEHAREFLLHFDKFGFGNARIFGFGVGLEILESVVLSLAALLVGRKFVLAQMGAGVGGFFYWVSGLAVVEEVYELGFLGLFFGGVAIAIFVPHVKLL